MPGTGNGSPRWKLNREDGAKLLTSLGLSVGGFVLVWVANLVPNIDLGLGSALAGAVAPLLANFGRKLIAGNQP